MWEPAHAGQLFLHLSSFNACLEGFLFDMSVVIVYFGKGAPQSIKTPFILKNIPQVVFNLKFLIVRWANRVSAGEES